MRQSLVWGIAMQLTMSFSMNWETFIDREGKCVLRIGEEEIRLNRVQVGHLRAELLDRWNEMQWENIS